MNKIASIMFFFSVVVLNAGCEKEPMAVKSLQLACQNTVFSVPDWYTDSIYYSGDRISLINKKFKGHPEKNSQARLEYNGDEVKIFVSNFSEGFWREASCYTLTYDGSRISQIETNSGRVKTDYCYANDYLSCILYHKDNKLTDSIVVDYDSQKNNIISAAWFKLDEITGKFKLANRAEYTYDNKRNPHQNSIHFLYNFYDCEEYSLDYFNNNNLKTVKSTLSNIHTDYIYNEFGYPIYIVFYDETNKITDTNIFDYDCN